MDYQLQTLMFSAGAIGLLHTLIGIDHTLPFVVLGRARNWSLPKTLTITGLCGVGHVLSSVFIGVIGIGLGVAVEWLEWIEGARGNLAAWGLIAFGLTYAGWALARRRRRQHHVHRHADGLVHVHTYDLLEHRHESRKPSMLTAWSLFLIFVLGPCEPLIPLLMVPALEWGTAEAVLVSLVFAVVTLGTMIALVTAGYYGMRLPVLRRFEVHADVLAGLAIAVTGFAIKLVGI